MPDPHAISPSRLQSLSEPVKMPVQVDVYFDPICPWCYIGMRRLRRALALRPEAQARLTWRPFMLNPDMPIGGMARDSYLLSKFGTEQRVRRLLGALEEHGQSESINFHFENIHQTPSTLDAHRLVRFAADYGLASEMVEALFSAYFVEGLDIGDRDTLAVLGRTVGRGAIFDARDLDDFLDSQTDSEWVAEENAKAHRLGINGVPCYLIAERFAVQGAQSPEILARLLDAALPVSGAISGRA